MADSKVEAVGRERKEKNRLVNLERLSQGVSFLGQRRLVSEGR